MRLKQFVSGSAAVGAWTLLVASGCGERSVPSIGIAMGVDTTIATALLPARQQRFNDSVGVRHQVRLVFESDALAKSSNATLDWANQLVTTPGVVGVVGHESSRNALQAAPVYSQHGITQIVPTGTSARLANATPWTFALVASDSAQGDLLARHLVSAGRRNVTIFLQDDEYGRGVVASLQRALLGHEVRILDSVVQTEDSDYDLLVRSVLKQAPAPDALVLVTQGMIAAEIARLAWAKRPDLLIVASDAANNAADSLRALAPTPERLALVTYWFPDTTRAATRAFLRDYRASGIRPAEPQWYHAAMYDAVGVLDAAASASGGSAKGVRQWLLTLGRSRKPYEGALGAIDFTGQHPIPARLIQPSGAGWRLLQ